MSIKSAPWVDQHHTFMHAAAEFMLTNQIASSSLKALLSYAQNLVKEVSGFLFSCRNTASLHLELNIGTGQCTALVFGDPLHKERKKLHRYHVKRRRQTAGWDCLQPRASSWYITEEAAASTLNVTAHTHTALCRVSLIYTTWMSKNIFL